jgi:hypothetical protein
MAIPIPTAPARFCQDADTLARFADGEIAADLHVATDGHADYCAASL